MGAPKGNQYAKGNRGGGDKPDSVKFRAFVNAGLANEIADEELQRIKKEKKRKREDLKEIVMPIVLKNMTEKKEFDIKLPKPILGGLSANEIPDNNSNEEVASTEKEIEGGLRGDECQ